MTTQDAYDKIREHFNNGAYFGYDTAAENCVYRGDRDPNSPVRCAVGCLIPDDIYEPEMDGQSVFGLLTNSSVARAFFYDVDQEFLQAAQRQHDAIASDLAHDGVTAYSMIYGYLRELFIVKLDRIAAEFNLIVDKA